jgi:N-acetylglucosamine kinase-like BadF-type ATPase
MVALSILNEAGAALADTAVSVLRKVGQLTASRVATAGTVLANSSHLRQAFRATLSAQLPGCRIVPAQGEPAHGASLLARKPALMPRDALQTRGQPPTT